MVPRRHRSLSPSSSAPRARGDGPLLLGQSSTARLCSPPVRGWTHYVLRRRVHDLLLPAYAGMVPPRPARPARTPTAPRVRGVGPRVRGMASARARCSLRLWGWLSGHHPQRPGGRLFPACAGSRVRGDGPRLTVPTVFAKRCSLYAWGWSHRRPLRPVRRDLVPVSAGDGSYDGWVDGKKGNCSLRARGWSRSRRPARPVLRCSPPARGRTPVLGAAVAGICSPHRGDGPPWRGELLFQRAVRELMSIAG